MRETATVKNYPFHKRYKSVLSRLSGARAPSMIRIVSSGYDSSDKLRQVVFVAVCVCVDRGVCLSRAVSKSPSQKYSDSNTATHC